MNKIYITNSLLDFKTRIIPKNAIILNLEKYKNYDNISEIINKLDISEIVCENKDVKKYFEKITDKKCKLIEELDIPSAHYSENDSYIIFFILSSFLTFLLFTLSSKGNLFMVAMVLIINFVFSLIIFNLFIKNKTWNIITHS